MNSFKNPHQYLHMSETSLRFIMKNAEKKKKKGTALRIKECKMSLKRDGSIISTILV